MSLWPHPATAEECDAIWPAIRADRLMESVEQLRAYQMSGSWRVRVTRRGEASLLGAWRAHLDVLAMRGVWCAERHVASFAQDAAEVARERGFAQVLSPLLPRELLAGYGRAGMSVFAPIVAIQGLSHAIRSADPPVGVTLRRGELVDAEQVALLDKACFDEFWRYGASEIADLLGHERMVVAQTGEGELIGYTLATASRGAATLGRLCTAPSARCQGIGRALLSEVAAWSVREGASTLSLCTQEENAASRSLYAAAGLRELDVPYAFAMRQA